MANFFDKFFNTELRNGGGLGMQFERFVNPIESGNLGGLDRQVMSHKCVKVSSVRLLTKVQLHRPPKLLVKSSLQLRL